MCQIPEKNFDNQYKVKLTRFFKIDYTILSSTNRRIFWYILDFNEHLSSIFSLKSQ